MKIIFTLVIALIISSFSFSQTISNAAQQSFCGAGTKVLTAVGVPPAATIQWEFSATGSAPWAASGFAFDKSTRAYKRWYSADSGLNCTAVLQNCSAICGLS